MRFLVITAFLVCNAAIFAADTDSMAVKKRKPLGRRVVSALYHFVKEFSAVDTNYVEPQRYNYMLMMQNTNTYEVYRISTKDGNTIRLAPGPSVKVGPYFGWRWIFLGYTVQVNHLAGDKSKKEFDLSLYSTQIGIDLFYRRTGSDYKIRTMNFGDDVDTGAMKGVAFDGIHASITGFNIYYIFNHRKFSYPAAFNQSTVQRRSCGSLLVGIGFTKHSLDVDWGKLYDLTADYLGEEVAAEHINPDLTSGKITYSDTSVSAGYGYNWVFARNCLFASSLSLALGYKQTKSDTEENGRSRHDFDISNFNIDGQGRFGLVWNNTKWFVGSSVILHAYNYDKKEFSTNNIFGSLNIYVGFNFDRR